MGSRKWLGSVTLPGCSESPVSIRFQLCLGFGWWSAAVLASLSGAWKALSQSVLVKRADLALVRCPRLSISGCGLSAGLGTDRRSGLLV